MKECATPSDLFREGEELDDQRDRDVYAMYISGNISNRYGPTYSSLEPDPATWRNRSMSGSRSSTGEWPLSLDFVRSAIRVEACPGKGRKGKVKPRQLVEAVSRQFEGESVLMRWIRVGVPGPDRTTEKPISRAHSPR